MIAKMNIGFLSSHHGTGACESLWLEAAARMAAEGDRLFGMVAWKSHDRLRASGFLSTGSPLVFLQPDLKTFASKVWNRLQPYGRTARLRLLNSLGEYRPDILFISQGNDTSALPWMEELSRRGYNYTLVTHGVVPSEWPDDAMAGRLRVALLKAKKTFWVSERNLEDVQYQIGCELPNASVVWNPVKWDRAVVLPWPDNVAETLKIACVSRLQVRSKGHDLLLRALASNSWRGRNWKLVFYGDGENRGGLESLSRFLGIEGKVEFAGHTRDLEGIWRGCHWLAQPSRHEGMPLSLVEALFAGRPALVTDVAGHAELVTDSENGIVAEAASVKALSIALDRVWESRASWQRMGDAAAVRIRHQMPVDPVGDYVEQLRGCLR